MLSRFLKNKSILHKSLSFVLIIVALSTFLNIGIVQLIKHRISNLKIEEQESYIDLYSYSADHIFDSLTNTISYIENSPSTQLMFLSKNYPQNQYLDVQEDIFDLLKTFTFTSSIIQEIFISSNDNPYLHTNLGLMKPKTFYDNRFDSDYTDWLDTISQYYPTPSLVKLPDDLSTSQSSSSYYFIKTITSSKQQPCNIVLILSHVFDQSLYSIPSDERSIFILNNTHEILASNSTIPLEPSLINEIITSDIPNHFFSESGLISIRHSILEGLYYIIYTPNNVLFGGLQNIFMLSFCISLLVMGILILITIKASSRLYQPFRTTLDVLKDTNLDQNFSADTDELSFIRRQVLQIASINHNLKNKLEDSTHLIFESILFKLIMGHENANKMLIENSHYSTGFNEGLYNTFVIRVDLDTATEELFFTDYLQTFTSIIYTHTEDYTLKIIETRQNEFTVVSYYTHLTQYEALIRDNYPVIVSQLQALLPHALFYIGCSHCTDSIIHLNDCYLESLQMIRHRNIKSETFLIVTNMTSSSIQPYLPNQFESELQTMLDTRQEDACKKYIQYILERNYKLEISMSSYLRVCITINNFLIRYCKSKHTTPNGLILLHHDDYLYSTQRITNIITTNLSLSCTSTPKKESQTLPVIKLIEQYVEEHFTEYINLSSVAQHLGYTSNYLSKFFKQEKGINFTDYLNRKRIEFAKHSLHHTSTNIKQIALESGFTSSTLFIRTFEKYEGITPGEYRKVVLHTTQLS